MSKLTCIGIATVTFMSLSHASDWQQAEGGSYRLLNADSLVLGEGAQLQLRPDPGYRLPQDIAGTCPEGEWQDQLYITGAIVNECELMFAFRLPPLPYQPIGLQLSTRVGISKIDIENHWPGGAPLTEELTGPVTAQYGLALNYLSRVANHGIRLSAHYEQAQWQNGSLSGYGGALDYRFNSLGRWQPFVGLRLSQREFSEQLTNDKSVGLGYGPQAGLLWTLGSQGIWSASSLEWFVNGQLGRLTNKGTLAGQDRHLLLNQHWQTGVALNIGF